VVVAIAMLRIPSILSYNSFDFLYLRFDHSFYLKNLYKHSQIIILKELLLIKQATTKEVIFCTNFLIRRVVKLVIKKSNEL
jgi:hypothetical protein